MEIADGRVLDLIEAGVRAGRYWRQERLATHPTAKKAWAGMALKRRAVGAALSEKICTDASPKGEASVSMPTRQAR